MAVIEGLMLVCLVVIAAGVWRHALLAMPASPPVLGPLARGTKPMVKHQHLCQTEARMYRDGSTGPVQHAICPSPMTPIETPVPIVVVKRTGHWVDP